MGPVLDAPAQHSCCATTGTDTKVPSPGVPKAASPPAPCRAGLWSSCSEAAIRGPARAGGTFPHSVPLVTGASTSFSTQRLGEHLPPHVPAPISPVPGRQAAVCGPRSFTLLLTPLSRIDQGSSRQSFWFSPPLASQPIKLLGFTVKTSDEWPQQAALGNWRSSSPSFHPNPNPRSPVGF